MFEYGQIIEYVDATYDENFNAAYAWCQENNATFDELIDKRKSVEVEYTELEMTEDGEVEKNKTRNELHRFFQINPIKPDPQPEPEPEPEPEPTQEEIAEQKRNQRDILLFTTDRVMLPDYPITDEERERYKQYRKYLRDLPESADFPNVDVLSFDDWNIDLIQK